MDLLLKAFMCNVDRTVFWGKDGDYTIVNTDFSSGSTPHVLDEIIQDRKCLVCITPTVNKLYGKLVADMLRNRSAECQFLVLDVREKDKNFDTVSLVIDAAAKFHLGRKDTFIAVGGGVCSDIVRTAAAMFRRGIPHICIPTTLIGQMDAAIGAKGGINHGGRKSTVGVFHPPAAVFVDPSFLTSLPSFYIREGLAEVLKLSCSLDRELFEVVESSADGLLGEFENSTPLAKEIVLRSIHLSLQELSKDLFEAGSLERTLDFGHTLSPLLETQSFFRISHGEAVAIDIALCAMISVQLNFISQQTANRIVWLIQRMGLPIWSDLMDQDFVDAALDHAEAHRNGAANLVIPSREIGASQFISESFNFKCQRD